MLLSYSKVWGFGVPYRKHKALVWGLYELRVLLLHGLPFSVRLSQEGVRAGFKAASIACVASAVPTLAAVRMIPWAKANLNYTAQALIISAASIAAYFITADKTILECARKNAKLEDSLRHNR
ncbi:early nodulin-93-like isoform X1 [Gastrolobium bilobum]|uniref:early nodulin-93-like isoform X1 n=1 Tax=Gastrolobium bilobum TaxID=150636 RepID=UPI002AB1009C|nr:early nodulin-93-like isoform X1 [Gastrolobium bilobum]XP_061373272.1 early nodulin-93-like isoform X1 [Gastrolobium bilobum]